MKHIAGYTLEQESNFLPKHRVLRSSNSSSFAQAYEESVAAEAGGGGGGAEDIRSIVRAASARMTDEEDRERGNMDWDAEPVCNRKVRIWTVLGVIVVVIGIVIAVVVSSVHKVNEGNVGIYFKHGALLVRYTYYCQNLVSHIFINNISFIRTRSRSPACT